MANREDGVRMRVLLINQTFYPDVVATAQYSHDLARDLVRHGHRVTVITSRSLYGKKGAPLPARERIDGVDVIRVGWSLFGKAGILARVADFAIFYLAATARALLLPRHDVSVCLTTPPFIALVGRLLRRVKGTRYVYWVMDLYPDLPIACGVMRERSPASRVFEALNRYCLRSADAVVVLGRCMAARVRDKGVDGGHIVRIGIWTDRDEVRPAGRERNAYRQRWGIDDRTLVMYAGNFGLGHDVGTFLAAAEALRDDDRIRFAFVGGGKRKADVAGFVRERGLGDTCIVAPYQPRSMLGELLTAGDVHLVTLLEGVEGIMVPSKLFGIMAAGRPAVFVGNAGSEIAQVIDESRCGASLRQGDVAGLVTTLRHYASDAEARRHAGQRGRESLVNEHGAKHRLAAWRALLEGLAAGARGRRS